MHPTIIASSEFVRPPKSLRGFALVGPDLVIGSSGAEEFGNVPPGQDGAYVTCSTQEAGISVIGTDDAGYGKVFLYTEGENWAAGSSLLGLAHYAKAKSWRLSKNQVQLLTLRMRGSMIAQQLTSSETVFSEISLLAPSDEIAVSETGSYSIRKRLEEPASSYEEQLSVALAELVGRARTLLTSNLPLVSDLSGGRDSRAVLAAIRYALGGNKIPPNLRFRSNPRKRVDFKIANQIAAHSAIMLNQKASVPAFRRTPQDAYRAWWANDLGVYHPVYPDVHFGGEIALSGAAGGAHRTVYTGGSLQESMLSLKSPELSMDAMQNIVDRAQRSVNVEGASTDEQLTHFRLFRNRIHGGRNSLRGVSIAPLAAKSLVQASNMLNAAEMERAQFYADLMFNLAPDLARHPYDDERKNWARIHRSSLTIVPLGPASSGGRVYGSELQTDERPIDPESDYIEPFRIAFGAACRDALDSGLSRRVDVDMGHAALTQATRMSFSHAVDAMPVAHIILIGEVARLADE